MYTVHAVAGGVQTVICTVHAVAGAVHHVYVPMHRPDTVYFTLSFGTKSRDFYTANKHLTIRKLQTQRKRTAWTIAWQPFCVAKGLL